MVMLPMLPGMSGWAATLLDASLLSALLFPLFFYLVYRLLIRGINQREASEVRLRALLDDTSAIGIVVIDQQCRIEEFNVASQAMFGYSKEQVIGSDFNLLVPEPYRGSHVAYVGNCPASGQPNAVGLSRELTALRRDGSSFPVSLVVDRVNVGDSSIFIGFIKDIGERKKMEEMARKSEEKYRELFDNASDFVYSTDADGILPRQTRRWSMYWGTAARRL